MGEQRLAGAREFKRREVGAILTGDARLSSHRPMTMLDINPALRCDGDWRQATRPTASHELKGL